MLYYEENGCKLYVASKSMKRKFLKGGSIVDFNELITSFSSIQSSTSFLAQTIVSAFISAMFSKRSDKKVTVYSAKIDFLNQIIYELQRDNIVTATEYLKCRNLADIAKLADEARKKQAKTTTENATDGAQHPVYDFDWFWRFFERAGYASNEDMKKLWACVLNGEIDHSGQFSYKAIETLFHMSPVEATVFRDMAQYSFNTPFGECILPSSDELYDNYDVTSPCVVDGQSDLHAVIAAAYGITNEKIMYLDEYGLLSSMLTVSSFSVTNEPVFITNDYYAIEIRLKENSQLESFELKIQGHRFSSVARQLFAVMEDVPSLSFFLDYARLIEKRYPQIDVKVFEIVLLDRESIEIEDSIDYLHDPSSETKTRLQSLDFELK